MAVAHAPIGVGDVALEVLASSGLAVDGVAFGVAPVRGVHEEVRIGDAEVELLAHRLDHQACERAPDEGDPEADERGRQLVERLNEGRGRMCVCVCSLKMAGLCPCSVLRLRQYRESTRYKGYRTCRVTQLLAYNAACYYTGSVGTVAVAVITRVA